MFIFKGNSTIRFDYRPNEQTEQVSKTGILMKIMKNLVSIASSFWAKYNRFPTFNSE